MTTEDLEMTDTPSTVLVLNLDLLFGSRISAAVKALGLQPRFVKTTEAFCAAAEAPELAIAILDMNAPVDWGAIAALLADPAIIVPIIGFGPHVDVDGRRAAKTAGLRRILSNGEFNADMAGVIRRYAKPFSPPD